MTIRSLATAVLLAVALSPAGGLAAQEREDTTVFRRDTTRTPADTLQEAAAQDTVTLPDSLRYHELPRLLDGAPEGFATGVWAWDRSDLMDDPALTLLELLEDVPGVVPLRGGDYGTPEGFSVFGLGGGRIRVYQDGFEMLPLDGAVVDLARVGLEGVESVRVERGAGEVRIELESLRAHDPRPMSLVEAGTGDLDTNNFRGTFVHPRALGGSLGLAIERVDTRGTNGREEGSRSGAWLRYTRHFGDRGGVRAELRRATVQSALDTFPDEVSRSDWVVRGRYEVIEGLVAEAYTGASSVEGGEDDGLTPIAGERSQHGLRASWDRGPLWARGAFRLMTGPDVPSTSLELEVGGALERLGGATARWSRDAWEGEGAGLVGVRAWSRPFYGLSAFASWESGERGARIFEPRVPLPPEDPEVPGEEPEEPEPEPEPEPEEPAGPTHRITDHSGLRLGGTFDWGPVRVGGAWLRHEADSLVPLGLHTDREGIVVPGGAFTGFEVSGRVHLVGGLSVHGAMQQWDGEARYLPRRTYQGGLSYHEVFLESDNFELWTDVGVQGRDPMLVPFPVEGAGPDDVLQLQRVPFQQRWNALIQARILTLYLVIRWDNFTIRRANQDFPGRVQPFTRTTYGIRWTLWN